MFSQTLYLSCDSQSLFADEELNQILLVIWAVFIPTAH